jgi:hypothetical protein
MERILDLPRPDRGGERWRPLDKRWHIGASSAVAPRSSLCPSYTSRGPAASPDASPLASASPILREPLRRLSRRDISAPLFCGDHCRFVAMWTYRRIQCAIQHPKALTLKEFLAVVFPLLFLAAWRCCSLNLSQVARYNREVYPHLHSDWAHTFMCRRCGKYSLIRP